MYIYINMVGVAYKNVCFFQKMLIFSKHKIYANNIFVYNIKIVYLWRIYRYMCVCVCVCVCLHIYVYIEKKEERKNERKREKDEESNIFKNMYTINKHLKLVNHHETKNSKILFFPVKDYRRKTVIIRYVITKLLSIKSL